MGLPARNPQSCRRRRCNPSRHDTHALTDALVGRRRAICAANRAFDRRGHPAVDRLDIELVLRAADALNFDFDHKGMGVRE
jgi:hypothetical protein